MIIPKITFFKNVMFVNNKKLNTLTNNLKKKCLKIKKN